MNRKQRKIRDFIILILILPVMSAVAAGLIEMAGTGTAPSIVVLIVAIAAIAIIMLRPMVKIDYEEDRLIIKKYLLSNLRKNTWQVICYDDIKAIEFINRPNKKHRLALAASQKIKFRMMDGKVAVVCDLDSDIKRSVKELLQAYDREILPQDLVRGSTIVRMRNYLTQKRNNPNKNRKAVK